MRRRYVTQSMKRKAEQILKVDVSGRVWTPRVQREAAVDAERCCGGAVVLDLPGGARMEIGDGAQVVLAAELLSALAARDFTGAVRC